MSHPHVLVRCVVVVLAVGWSLVSDETVEAGVPQPIIAYEVPADAVGNQDVGGIALGMDFDLQLDILITRLGVFDSGSDGLATPIIAKLYDRDDPSVELVAIEFTPDEPGDLVGGSRFKEFEIDLPAGFHGSIVACGYNGSELNGNTFTANANPLGVSVNDGGCAILFTGGGRFGNDGVSYPATADGGPANRYAAGTFEFIPQDEFTSFHDGIAYNVPANTPGNQNANVALGMDFNVNTSILITRLGVFEDDALTGGAIAYVYASPAEACLVSIPDGPVLDWSSPEARATFNEIVAVLRKSVAPDRAVVLRVEPRLIAVPEALTGLPRSPVDLVPEETLEIDLGTDAEMLARMKPKGRYNVRLAARHGVEVETSVDPADVHELYAVLEHTARFQGFRLEPKSFFINLARAMFPPTARVALVRASANIALVRASAQIALARWKGITLAAALTVRHGRTATYLYGGHLPLFPEVMASYALHWHVMREAAADGYGVYDLYGYVPPGRAEHPYDGFSRFKEKLGGRPVRRIGSRDVVFYDRLAGAAVRVMRHAAIPVAALAEEEAP